MTQIKSENAKEYIWEKIPWVYLDGAVKAILIAETEAEERHAKEMQELRDRAVAAFKIYLSNYHQLHESEPRYNELLQSFINELRK